MVCAAIGCSADRARRTACWASTRSIVNAMLLLLTFGIRTGSTLYFEAALVIGLLGFVGTVALAKFLMRGEVIE